MPGIQTMLNSLNKETSQLPNMAFEPVLENIGDSTLTAMNLGVQCAAIGGIKEGVDNLRKIIPNAKVVVTGGWSRVIKHLLPQDWQVEPDLTLIGIYNCALKIIISSSTEDAFEPYVDRTSSSQQFENL